MAISNAMSTSLMSASNSMKIVRAQQGAKKQMDGKAGVLRAEIMQDGGRGGNTQKKEAELEGVREKAEKIQNSQMDNLSEMNANMKKAEKEDQREQEAAKAAEEKRAEKRKAKKAAEKKQEEKKAQEERIKKISEKDISVISDRKADETEGTKEADTAGTKLDSPIAGTIDEAPLGITPSSQVKEAIGGKVDVQV